MFKYFMFIAALVASFFGASITFRAVTNIRLGKGAPAWAAVFAGLAVVITALSVAFDALKSWDQLERGAELACRAPMISRLCDSVREQEADRQRRKEIEEQRAAEAAGKAAAEADAARRRAEQEKLEAERAERRAKAAQAEAEAAIRRKKESDRAKADAEARELASLEAARLKGEELRRLRQASADAFNRRDYRSAMSINNEIIRRTDDGGLKARTIQNNSCIMLELGNKTEAYRLLQQALAVDPNDPSVNRYARNFNNLNSCR